MASDLQSENHRDLLDIIDQLRSQGFSRYVDLPEIIVCGDQSAGKSSVLEAISGMSFPTKDNLCTRFATELILRRDPTQSVSISITPVDDRNQDDKDAVSSWRPQADIEKDGLEPVIEEAKRVMGLTTTKAFSNDILRVELSGPAQPHLTMVDLPGLFRAGNREQSADNVELVKSMVKRYMHRPRSIILAVVSAKSEYVLQDVTALAKEADPKGLRTMGLITKPDMLDVGSDSERWWLTLAANQNVELTLGWHVLKNRSYEQRLFSSEKRDSSEEEFFKSGAWSTAEPTSCGVKSLKTRLSHVLKEQILKQLPSLVADVEKGIEGCNTKLSRLGDARENPEQQRRYLTRISQEFTRLMTAAIHGIYNMDDFFGTARKMGGYEKRLRAVVQNRLEDFEKAMHSNGQSQTIVDTEPNERIYGERDISRSDFIDGVKTHMRLSRGCELPGLFSPSIVDDLFSQQCRPWREITFEMTQDTLDAVFRTTRLIVEQTAADDVADKLLMLLNATIEEYKAEVDAKVEELLPQASQHAITYNHQLTINVQAAQRGRKKKMIEKKIRQNYPHYPFQGEDGPTMKVTPDAIMNLYSDEFETDMRRFGASLAVDYMEAYYKVAFERFIDDVSNIAIETCLIRKLPLLLTPSTVLDLDEAKVRELVGESEDTALSRTKLNEKLGLLQKGLQDIKRFQTHRADISETKADVSMMNAKADESDDEEVKSTLGSPGEPVPPYMKSRSPSRSRSPSPAAATFEYPLRRRREGIRSQTKLSP